MLKQVQHDEVRREASVLQIIVWLGCFYLVLKGLQLLQAGLAAPDDKGSVVLTGYIGFILGVGGAIAFFVMANSQVENTGLMGATSSNASPDYGAGRLDSDGTADVDAAVKDAENAAAEAMKAGEEAAKEAEEAMNAATQVSKETR